MSDFGEFFSRFDPPVLVATTTDGAEQSGCLVGFGTQCSIHPPRLLVCVSVLNRTADVLERANVLAVHLLGGDQLEVASLFGEETGDTMDKFSRVGWHTGITGAPVLDACAAWIETSVVERYPLGDHVGCLLETIASGTGSASRVLHQSDVAGFHAGHPSDEAEGSDMAPRAASIAKAAK